MYGALMASVGHPLLSSCRSWVQTQCAGVGLHRDLMPSACGAATCELLLYTCISTATAVFVLGTCHSTRTSKLRDSVAAGNKVPLLAMLVTGAPPGKHISRPQLDGE